MARRKQTQSNIHEIFSDVAFLMLATFVFLLVLVMVSSRFAEENELPELKEEVAELREKLEAAQAAESRLKEHLEQAVVIDMDEQIDTVLRNANTGRRDFDLFIEGLKEIPGRDLHMMVDATGSMHGVSTFLVPVLRLIVIRSGKQLSALTWFANNRATTYTGSMGDMFDYLMTEAPFAGHLETIGHAFRSTARDETHTPPSAYLLIGDEPSDDTINYSDIPSPVFTIPLGRADPGTLAEYGTLSERTGGKMLHLDFN
jgi:hypothetical protein